MIYIICTSSSCEPYVDWKIYHVEQNTLQKHKRSGNQLQQTSIFILQFCSCLNSFLGGGSHVLRGFRMFWGAQNVLGLF